MGVGHFRSKVARRILVSFVLAALIPAAALSTLLYFQAREQIREQTLKHLHQEVKGYGSDILERLATMTETLRSVALLIEGDAEDFPVLGSAWVREQFTGLVLIRPTHAITRLLGEIPDIPPLTEEDMAHAQGGKPGIRIRHPAEDERDVLLLLPVSEGRPERGMLVARLNPKVLWNTDAVLPDAVWIFDDRGELVFASEDAPPPDPHQTGGLLGRQFGYVTWNDSGQVLAAASWPLFLKARFAAETWTIVLIQPESDAFSIARRFALVYLPVTVVLLLCVAMLSNRLIRRHLNPIEQLTAATGKIAEGDFDHPVQITSHDEFQVLAESFNRMAKKIRDQLVATSAMAEIDRTILSSFNAEQVIETVLDRLPGVLQCDVICFARFDPESRRFQDMRMSRNGEIAERLPHSAELSARQIGELVATELLEIGGGPPDYLAVLARSECRKVLILPILLNRQLAAVMGLGYRQEERCSADVKNGALSFRDRIAVALSNAAWEEKLYRQAHYDALTGLANRLVLRDILARQLARARRDDVHVAVMFIDLDRFKNVNDSLGHSAGDELLVQVARTLTAQVRETDMVVRLGGDEFVISIPDLPKSREVTASLCAVAEKLLAALDQSFVVEGHVIGVSASIGIALYPNDAQDMENLLKNADAAMFRAKAEGKGNFQFYSPEFNANALETVKLEHELRRALEHREFVLYYQPKVNATGDIIGAEALIRWDSPVFGRVPPNRFIPLAEEIGLIGPLGDWVLETACLQTRWWAEHYPPALKIAVNMSAIQLRRADAVDRVARILDSTGVDPAAIELEITESISMIGAQQAVARLTELKGLGVSLAMDDFGTGYSSLAYLRQFPLDVLKVDQSFVRSVHSDRNSQAIVRAILALAEGLELATVAEGVETRQHFEFLTLHGCAMFQGYLFGPPVPVARFEELLLRRASKSRDSGALPDLD
jgi:diguanylate cyclase (GGDEF)-like protein